jgi:hypothetical protein
LISEESSFDMKFLKLAQKRQNLKFIKISLVIVFIFQASFWYKTETIKPELGIVPDLPSKYSAEALSFGDKEFYFRTKGMRIQNAGDTFGRVTPLKNYDYEKLYNWFSFFDTINSKSNYIPSLASYYYSNSQNDLDNVHIVKYLEEHYDLDPSENWWWMYQAIFLSAYKIKDKDLALRLAYKLRDTSGDEAPIWTKQMVAIIHGKFGENCEALRVINEILDDYENERINVDENEINFMLYFIGNKVKNMKKEGFDPRSCEETRKSVDKLKMRDEEEYRDPSFIMEK